MATNQRSTAKQPPPVAPKKQKAALGKSASELQAYFEQAGKERSAKDNEQNVPKGLLYLVLSLRTSNVLTCRTVNWPTQDVEWIERLAKHLICERNFFNLLRNPIPLERILVKASFLYSVHLPGRYMRFTTGKVRGPWLFVASTLTETQATRNGKTLGGLQMPRLSYKKLLRCLQQ